MKLLKLAQVLVALPVAAFALTVLVELGNWFSLAVWLVVGGLLFLAGSLTIETAILFKSGRARTGE